MAPLLPQERNDMNPKLFFLCLSFALFGAPGTPAKILCPLWYLRGAGPAAADPASPVDADDVRGWLEDCGISHEEIRKDGGTTFAYSLARDDRSPRFRCTVRLRDGSAKLVSAATYLKRVPTDRRRAVADRLLDLNRRRAAGSFRLDWRDRRISFELYEPAAALDAGTGIDTLLFVLGPSLYFDEDAGGLLALAGLAQDRNADAAAEEDPDSATADAEDESADAKGGEGESREAIGEELSAESASDADPGAGESAGDEAYATDENAVDEDAGGGNAAADEGDRRHRVAALIRGVLQEWGAESPMEEETETHVYFQFTSSFGHWDCLFTRSVTTVAVYDNWVTAMVSPELAVSGELRGAVAEWAMRATGPGERARFVWAEEDDCLRIGSQSVLPACLFEDGFNPRKSFEKLLQNAAIPLAGHSRSLAAVASGLMSPAKALAAEKAFAAKAGEAADESGGESESAGEAPDSGDVPEIRTQSSASRPAGTAPGRKGVNASPCRRALRHEKNPPE